MTGLFFASRDGEVWEFYLSPKDDRWTFGQYVNGSPVCFGACEVLPIILSVQEGRKERNPLPPK